MCFVIIVDVAVICIHMFIINYTYVYNCNSDCHIAITNLTRLCIAITNILGKINEFLLVDFSSIYLYIIIADLGFYF